MIARTNKCRVLHKVIASAIVCLFLVNDIAWSQPSSSHSASIDTLAAQSRLKPFFEKYGLGFQNIALVTMAASELKKMVLVDRLREGPLYTKIESLNRLFNNDEIEIENQIRTARFESSGREYKYAVFHFKAAQKTINVLFLENHTNLTADELDELRILKKEKHNLGYPGLEGVWFINLAAADATQSKTDLVKNTPTVTQPVVVNPGLALRLERDVNSRRCIVLEKQNDRWIVNIAKSAFIKRDQESEYLHKIKTIENVLDDRTAIIYLLDPERGSDDELYPSLLHAYYDENNELQYVASYTSENGIYLSRKLFEQVTPEDLKLLLSYKPGEHPDALKQYFAKDIALYEAQSPKHFDLITKKANGERPVEINYHNRAMSLLESTNPGITARIEKVLTTSFSKLIEGVDYYKVSGDRSIMLKLDRPIRVDGKDIIAIKIKGVVFEANTLATGREYDVVNHMREAGPSQGYVIPRGVRALELTVDEDGFVHEDSLKSIPFGGIRYENARNEYRINFDAQRAGLDISLPFGYGYFKNESTKDGERCGFCIMGVPDADGVKANDILSMVATEHYDAIVAQEDTEEFQRFKTLALTIFYNQGRALRIFNNLGFAHTNFHLGNFSIINNSIFFYDTEATKRRMLLTEKQFFGYMLHGLYNAITAASRVEHHAFYSKLAFDMVGAFLEGYFEDLVDDPLLKRIDPARLKDIFVIGKRQALYTIDNPLVKLLKKAFSDQISFRPGDWVTAKRIIEKPGNGHLRANKGFTLSQYLVALDQDESFKKLPRRMNGHRIADNTARADLDKLIKRGNLKKEGKNYKYITATPLTIEKSRTMNEGARNSIYIDASVADGKRQSGIFVGAWPGGISQEILETYPDCVMTDVASNSVGSIYAGNVALVQNVTKGVKGFTIVYKNGNPVKIYDKNGKQIPFFGDEESSNALFVDAEISDGVRKNGTFIRSFPDSIPAETFKQYPRCVLANVEPSSSGVLSIGGMIISQHVDRKLGKLTVVFENGLPIKVYDEYGKAVSFWGDKDAKNALYAGAKIVNGKRRGGKFIKAYPGRVTADILEQFPDCIVENCESNSKGGFSFGKIFWDSNKDLRDVQGLTAHFVNGEVEALYDKDGSKVYGKATEGSENSVYVNATIKNGKRHGGQFVGCYPNGIGETLKQHPDCIISNITLKSKGRLTIGTRALVSLGDSFAGKEGMSVWFKSGEVFEIYDDKGACIYHREDRTKSFKRLFTDAKVINGKRKGGKMVYETEDKIPKDVWDMYPDCVVEVEKLGANGQLTLGGLRLWNARVDLKEAEDITVLKKEGVVTNAYDCDGKEIFRTNDEDMRNAIFIGATIHNGCRVGGEFIGAYPMGIREDVLDSNKSFIVCNAKLNANGGFTMAGNPQWVSRQGCENLEGVTIVIINGEAESAYDSSGKKIYPAEKTQNALYINATIENGKMVKGELVDIYPYGVPQAMIKRHPNCVITDVSLNEKTGGLFIGGKHIWTAKKGFEGISGLTIVFEDGEVDEVYDSSGTPIYDTKPRLELYTGSRIEKGRRVGGMLQGVFKRTSRNLLSKYPDCIIANITISSNGMFYIAKKPIKIGNAVGEHRRVQPGEEGIIVVLRNKEVVQIYNSNGMCIKADGLEGMNYTVYLGVKRRTEDGSVYWQKFAGAYPDGLPDDFIDLYPNCTVRNVPLGKDGSFSINGNCIWGPNEDLKNAQGITLVIRDKEIITAFDRAGTVIYSKEGIVEEDAVPDDNTIPSDQKLAEDEGPALGKKTGSAFGFRKPFIKPTPAIEGARNSLYVGAKISNGKRRGGRFILAYPQKMQASVLKEYPNCIIEHVQLSEQGNLVLAGKTWAYELKGRENEGEITAVVENSIVTYAYDKNGECIYKHKSIYMKEKENRNALYVDAVIANGRLQKGNFIAAYPNGITETILKSHPDCVITNVKLNKFGGYSFAGKHLWDRREGYEYREGLTVEVKDSKVVAMYDDIGLRIYPHGEHEENAIYINATIQKGKRVGGEFIGAYPQRIPGEIRDTYMDCIIANVRLNSLGNFTLGTEFSWPIRSKLANLTGVTAVRENGMITAAYDKDGNEIFKYEKPSSDSKNAVYIGGEIEGGRIKGGTFIGAYPLGVSKKFLDEHPDFIITNADIGSQGRFYLGSKFQFSVRPLEYADGITAVVKNKKVVAVFDKDGELVYERDDTYSSDKFKKLLDDGDIERLLGSFGLEGTYRMLLRLHGFTPVSLRNRLSAYLSTRNEGNIPHNGGTTGNGFSFVRARRISIPEAGINMETGHLLADEIIRSIYKDIVRDHRFLDKILAESLNENNSPMLRKAYKEAYDYYKGIEGFNIKWINEEAIALKFYQKIGIKFMIDKKKAILADEPGLGKTIEAIAAALNIRDGKGADKVLVVCPKSAKRFWQQEITTKTTGGQTVVVINSARDLSSRKKAQKIKNARFVIVNYDAIRGKENVLREELARMKFDCIIVDEAHRLRNESLQTSAIRQLDAEYKFLLTGTPIVGRKTSKIFNLLNWLSPETFSDKNTFAAKYSGSASRVRRLSEDIREFLIRRLKKDVLNLPPKTNISVPVFLDEKQRNVYDAIEKDFLTWFEQHKENGSITLPIILTKLIRLKQAAIDAGLVEKRIIFINGNEKVAVPVTASEVILHGKRYSIMMNENDEGDIYLCDANGRKYFVKDENGHKVIVIDKVEYTIIAPRNGISSAKFEQLDKLVAEKIQRGEKIVIFTEFRDVVFLLKERYKKYGVNYLYGGMTATSAAREIECFQTQNDYKIFIATRQSGGEAISLNAANNVIFVDKPWTSQERDQAIDRLHRLGQTRPVNAYSLIAMNTIDEYVEELLFKSGLVFELALEEDPSVSNLSDELIEAVLKKLHYSREVIDTMKSLRKKAVGEDIQSKPETTIEVADASGKLKINWSEKGFHAQLKMKDGKIVTAQDVPELIGLAADLSNESGGLVRTFFAKKIASEVRTGTPIKQSILWSLLIALKPMVKDMDYHGDTETSIEIGRYIVNLLIVNEDITIEELNARIKDKNLVGKSLYFLDRNNIFRALSLLGVFNKQFYYSGKLLSYDPPIKIYSLEGKIKYIDEEIVESIAPKRVNMGIEFQSARPFESESNKYRKLERDEEIRLAREAHKGNIKAEDALIHASMRFVVHSARGVLSSAKKRIEKSLDGFEIEDLYITGQEELVKMLPAYYAEFENRSLEEFMKSYISKAMWSTISAYAKVHSKEYGDEIATESDETLSLSDYQVAKQYREEHHYAVEERNEEDEEPNDLMEKSIQLLRDDGFREDEIDIFMEFVNGRTPVELGKKYSLSIAHINDIINTAREALKESQMFSSSSKSQKKPPQGSISSVFEYLCSPNLTEISGGVTGQTLSKDIGRAYATIDYDVRALLYHLKLIQKPEDDKEKTGKDARYYVPESVKKKKDLIMPILVQFIGENLRPDAKLLDRIYEEQIKPILEVDKNSAEQSQNEWLSAQNEAVRIHNENLKYTPNIPQTTILCHIIIDSILPDGQRAMLKTLEKNMRDKSYSEKVVSLSISNPDNFIEELNVLMAKQRELYKGYVVDFDAACPSIEGVKAILGSSLGIKALAFEPCKEADVIQIEGIILALRALNSGKIESLREAFSMLMGKELPQELLAVTDINELIKRITFILPAAKLINYNHIKQLNEIIRKSIEAAA